MVRHASIALASMVMVAGLSGCLVSQSSSTKESGVRVSQTTLSNVQPGETTEEWVLATLGPPTCRSKVDQQTDILRYDHSVETRSGGKVFLLFSGSQKKQTTNSVFIEVKDSVVSRYWTES